MDVNIPRGEKFDPSNEPSMVDAKWGRQKKSFKIYIWLPWETCMRYAKRPCCFIVEVRNCRTDFPNFWWTVCSRWRRSANDQWRTVLNYKKEKKKKKRILNAPLPIYLCLPMWAMYVWPIEQAHGEWNSTVQCHEAILLPRARELWTDWVHGVSSQLTDTKMQTEW